MRRNRPLTDNQLLELIEDGLSDIEGLSDLAAILGVEKDILDLLHFRAYVTEVLILAEKLLSRRGGVQQLIVLVLQYQQKLDQWPKFA